MKAALACLVLLAVVGTAGAQTTESGWFDLAVPGGERTLAAMGMSTGERASVLALAARMASSEEWRSSSASLHLREALRASTLPSLGASEEDEPLPIPTPLTADLWSELLALAPGENLFARLLADRAATLLAAGFTSTDPSIRQLALGDRGFVRRIYREAPGAFAVVARSLRIEGGRVVVPGGAGADKIWDVLSGEPPSNPRAFIRGLVTKDGGRLAWYFDTLSSLEPTRMRDAWPDAAERDRLANARALYESFRRVELRWRLEEQPFRRSAGDPWLVLMFTDVRDGVVAGPNWPWFWETIYANGVLDRAAMSIGRRRTPPVSLTWVARAIADASVRERKDRFEMFRLAQRVFPTPRESDATDLAIAISGYRRYKALLLALERMDITSPATWAALVETARHVDGADGKRDETLAVFQGTFALIYRMWHVGSVDSATAHRLLRSLADGVRTDNRVTRNVGRWIADTLIPALQPRTVLDALAGASPDTPPSIEWEGLEYRLDFAAAERARLDRIVALTSTPSLEAAVAADDASAMATALKALAYAIALGDPDGAVTLGPEIASRHVFGAASQAQPDDPTPWAMPTEMQLEGQPWHVRGSIVGLELGLARLSLRHLAGDQMPGAPTLTMNDYGMLARTAVSMRPAEFTDEDRDEIVAALARGRRRVAEAGTDLGRLTALARAAHVSPATRGLLSWTAAREPQALRQLFSMRDLLWLGEPSLSSDRLDRWGMLAQAVDGRLTTAMPRPRPWEDFAGRADTGLMSAQVPDLTLRLAEETARLGLPAALVPAMFSYAAQDYWYDTRVRFPDDWLAMSRQAAALGPERVEDYVAALAGTGPLRLGEVQH